MLGANIREQELHHFRRLRFEEANPHQHQGEQELRHQAARRRATYQYIGVIGTQLSLPPVGPQMRSSVCGRPLLPGPGRSYGILAVSDLESHHRARGNCPWVFWDPLLHVELGFAANPLFARGRGSTATKTVGNERFVNLRITTEKLKYSTMHNFHGL